MAPIARVGKLSLLFCLAALVGACSPRPRTLVHDVPGVPEVFFVDPQGRPFDQFTRDDATLWRREGGRLVPVLSPDGQPTAWGEFRRATGVLTIVCDADGTVLTLEAQDLYDAADYGLTLFMAGPPGLREAGSAAILGGAGLSGALRSVDGRLLFETRVRPGPMEFAINGHDQPYPACLLDSYEFGLYLNYLEPPDAEGVERAALHLAWIVHEAEPELTGIGQ